MVLAYSTNEFTSYTTETITADALGKSQVIAVHMPDQLWLVYSSTTFKGGEWSGVGELTANNDADLYLVTIDDSTIPEFNLGIVMAILGMVAAVFLRRR